MARDPDKIIKEIFTLYSRYGSEEYAGEPVSQLEHMSQAALLAMKHNSDDEVVVAAFFHDIGHICVMQNEDNDMDGFGTVNHEKVGADFLREKGFSDRVARLVENHVQAKRYLTYKFPEYYASLSMASKQTLLRQGGIMTAGEAGIFEKDPLFHLSIRMREWDEQAKEMHVPIVDLEIIKSMVRRLLQKNTSCA